MERATQQTIAGLGTLSLTGALLFAVGAIANQSLDHWSILWNLFLAWIPFVCSIWLVSLLRTRRWQSWLPLAVTFAWLVFIPNSFYMITDFIHLHDVARVDEVYDTAMFGVIIVTGVLLGFASLALVHRELRRKLGDWRAWRLVLIILLVISWAIYVGRYLRWNTWDIVTSPIGILFDISEHLLYPFAHPQAFITTTTFFIVLTVSYGLLWKAVLARRK